MRETCQLALEALFLLALFAGVYVLTHAWSWVQ